MKKLLSLVLCAAMLLCCVCSAETSVINLNVQSMGEVIADVTASIGFDDDGCSQASVSGNVAETLINAFAQIGAQSIVYSVNGSEPVEITADVVVAAITELVQSFATEAGIDLDAVAAVFEYVTSDAFTADMEVIGQVAVNEINRIAQLASMSGIVTIDEAGNLTIVADLNSLVTLAKTYLEFLAADTTVFAALASTTAWQMLGLSADGSAEAAMVASLAARLENVSFGSLQASFVLNVYAEGAGQLTFNASDAEGSLSISATVNADGSAYVLINGGDAENRLNVVFEANDSCINFIESMNDTVFQYNIVPTETGISAAVSYMQGETPIVTANAEIDFVNKAVTASGLIMGTTFALNAAVNAETMGFDATLVYGETIITLNAGMTAEGKYVVTAALNGAPVFTAGIDMMKLSENTIDAFLTIGETTYTLTAGIDAEGTYYVNASVNGIPVFGAALYAAKLAEGTVDAYVTVNGQVLTVYGAMDPETGIYTLTASMDGAPLLTVTVDTAALTAEVQLANGIYVKGAIVPVDETTVAGTITYGSMTENGPMDVLTATLTVATNDAVAAHVDGRDMTVEELEGIIMQVIERFAAPVEDAYEYEYDYAA